MEFLQTYYNKLLDKCFAHPYVTLLGGIASVLVGIFLMGKLPQKLMPVADRNQFPLVSIRHTLRNWEGRTTPS